MLLNILSIFIGGGIGSVLRFFAGECVLKYGNCHLAVATLAVNIVGAFIIGFAYALFMDKTELNPAVRYAVTIGFCGGLTTFSTFSLELLIMLKNAEFMQVIVYILSSVIICVAAAALGVYCAKFV
ncbi:MAG: fluoride efflux transporter CrcB [Heliobacteriaceae bacterium]|jgi:CrcB protein|nr:fluoride efflux transporter CrcB [Heliobacteriaceae bacterium]